MNIASLFKTAAAAGTALALSATAALAVEATATVELNVRTGPGTNFGVIDTLAVGERVNTTECVSTGWCYVEQAEQNGWVSKNFLQAVPPPSSGGGGAPDCELRLTLGGGSPRLELICETAPGGGTPPPPPPPPVGAQACFYHDNGYHGASFCYAPGQLNSLNAQFNDRISSVRLNGNIGARLCVHNNMGGYCTDITHDTPGLGAAINNRTSSLQVYALITPPPVIVPPVIVPPVIIPPVILPILPITHKTGGLSIASSFTADFDAGTTGAGGADVWHHAINAAIRRLEVRGGAQLALGDGSNRGYAGCRNAAFSTAPVPFASLSVGTYVCVKTDQGRISQFRVNSYTGTTMNVGFTTWAN